MGVSLHVRSWGFRVMTVFSAGPFVKLATYYSDDNGEEADADVFVAAVAAAIEQEGADGWVARSTSVYPARHMGSAGNVLFQTGGAYTTLLVAVVQYGRD